MKDHIQNPSQRKRFAGVLQIARYNWPQYVGGFLILVAGGAWLALAGGQPGWLRFTVWTAAALTAWWCVASLAASYWVYDRSELYQWTWIVDVLPVAPTNWLNLHAGLDESSTTLQELFPHSEGRVGDFYDSAEMSEPSIRRARAEQKPPTATRIDRRQFPFAEHAFDTVFLLFAAHELRRASSRETFFREVRRVLGPTGNLLLVEHLRNFANFAAFGPGFFHFQADHEWRRLARCSGLEIVNARRMTPFVKIYLLRKTP